MNRREKLDKLLISLFRRMRNRDSLIRINDSMLERPLEDLIFKAHKMVDEIIAECRELNFDVEKFLGSDRGQAAYLRYSVDIEQQETNLEKCHRCSNYWLGKSVKTCPYHREGSMIFCKDFDDTGYDLDDRIYKFSVKRCSMCENVDKIKDKMFEEYYDYECSLGLNMGLPICQKYKERKTSENDGKNCSNS